MSVMTSAPLSPPATLTSADPTRVLVVDDELPVRKVTRLMLERAGHAVEEAGDASAAVDRVRAAFRPFDVVLLDVTLPDRSGTDLVRELRILAPGSRVVLTSGRMEADYPAHGADGYLPKPFSNDQLLRAVRAVIGAV
jgi:CheY-like chemotaxis protein